MKRNEKGFGMVEGLLIIVVILLIGFIGYYVYSQNKSTTKSLDNNTKTSDSTPAKQTQNNLNPDFTETYSSKAGKTEFSFKYPKTWKLQKGDPSNTTDSSDKIYSPDNELYISTKFVSQDNVMGGVGSNCDEMTTKTIITDVQKATLPLFPDAKLISYRTSDGEFNEYVGNSNTKFKSSINSVSENKSVCVATFTSWFNWTDYGYGSFVIVPNKYLDKNNAVNMSVAQISDYVNSESHKTALDIAKTLKATN